MKQDIDFDKFNQKSINAIDIAYKLAKSQKQNPVEVSHLLYAILSQWNSTIENFIIESWNSIENIKLDINNQIFDLLKKENWFISTWDMHMSRVLSDVFLSAETNAKIFWDAYIRPEHILLSISQTNDYTQQILSKRWITSEKIKNLIKSIQSDNEETIDVNNLSQQVEDTKNISIFNYWEDISKLVRENKLDEIMFREEELNNIIQILLRSSNSSPIVVWESWSGKTSLIYALAQKIAKWEIPEHLKDKKIISLDIWKIWMWNKYSGDLENKLKSVLIQAQESKWELILFFDDFQNLIELFERQWSTDLWILLKSILSKWNIKIIWTTDIVSYNNLIQQNSSLSRIFQRVDIQVTNIEDTLTILRSKKNKLEKLHWIKISQEAIVSAVELADRYISNREFPDKAIDLLDESIARKKMTIVSLPDNLLKLRESLLRLETQKSTLSSTSNLQSDKKIAEINSEIQDLQSQYNEWIKNREFNKNLFEQNQVIYSDISKIELEINTLENPELEYKLIEKRKQLIWDYKKSIQENSLKFKDILWSSIKDIVEKEDIASVISIRSWISIEKINKTETQKLLELENRLSTKVVGQDEAIRALSNAVRRARSWLNDPNKPIWSFVFMWPTWVWKTELAKALAEILFDDEKFLIRIDMSEYQEKHSVSRLIGSPPWYVGYDQWWQLTEAIKEKPYSVILFDEMEKADPDVFKILLQVLDDGRLTDWKGRTISFKNTIIIMTSNLWWDVIIDTFEEIRKEKELKLEKQHNYTQLEIPFPEIEKIQKISTSDTIESEKILELKDWLKESIKKKASPEFLNRIDEVIMFNPISKEILDKIVDIHLNKFLKRLNKDKNIILNVTPEVKIFIWEKWRDPAMWARPVKRAIQDYLANPLSKEIISWNIIEWDIVNLQLENEKLIFKK